MTVIASPLECLLGVIRFRGIGSPPFAPRAELKDSGVTVTCLMPGATGTDFFERADMLEIQAGQSMKDDRVDVARVGFDAMMRGAGDGTRGGKDTLQSATANVTRVGALAGQHRRMAEPDSARKAGSEAARMRVP